ncbi:MAG: tRNA preQ1(34) S-adenosylmethionine ribosyltransferase-isomerase QueA [Proteobacteria bacterium]|jgi:S-adenosylmethionine:tRNA ribosyltransferase-isomerase|nr:tRNA preQ1(34) S-adenosylmethionine ribosyltransferase-isomerase QueA [Pseudomonadota bacterium]
MKELDRWDYDLPPDQIALYPPEERVQSRLMLVGAEYCNDHRFVDLPSLLRPGDLLVANNTRVMAARLFAHRQTGGRIQLLLLETGEGRLKAMAQPMRRLVDGEALNLVGGGQVRIWRRHDALVDLEFDDDPTEVMSRQGEVPLPPYLRRQAEPIDSQRYQTVYAGPLGAAAAPTAGLHFTHQLIEKLKSVNIGFETITLHVGLGTFRPITPENLAQQTLHEEAFHISAATAEAIGRTHECGGQVIAVGTTTTRALEAATPLGKSLPIVGSATTKLFIRPPYDFRCIDGLITNFHLPRSSLLMLVGSLIGRQRLLEAYTLAVERRYRFYSYGDAMLLL